jgi:hypothetical protein
MGVNHGRELRFSDSAQTAIDELSTILTGLGRLK